MNIFLTGATGVMGKALVPRLVAAGHEVTALSRTPANEEWLRKMQARPVQVNLYDGESLKQVVAGQEAIIHLATKIPPTSKVGKLSAWEETDRLRRDGTRCLVDAALAVGSVQTFIYPSFAAVYPDSGSAWIEADTTPVASVSTLGSTLDGEAAVARFASSGAGRRGISLRMGFFYGPECSTAWEMFNYARQGIGAFPGRHDAYTPSLWLQDAASALFVAACEPVPSGIYDIVDDEPITRADLFDALAQAVGRKRLFVLPQVLVRMMSGTKYDEMGRSLRISNRRLKAISSWKPSVPNARTGWQLIAEASKERVTV